MKQYFAHTEWSAFDEASTANDKWNLFLEIYNDGVRQHVPRMNRREVMRSDWFDRRCMEARSKRDKMWNKWKRNRRPSLWENYKGARNDYVRLCRETKRNYEKDIVDKCKDQPKLFYRFINGKLKKKEGISKLEVDDLEYIKAADMAEVMNDSFQKVFTLEDDFNDQEEISMEGSTLNEIEVSVDEVKKMLNDLDVRKAHGPDGVSNWVLKECSNELSTRIHSIIDCSLKEGKFPADWKKANIVPIYKGGKREDPMNYRPVSLTSVVAKICERAVKDKWMEYLETNTVLSDKQFGFRKGRSTTNNLISFYSRVIDIIQERDGWADCIYLDLKKAFDKVPHKRLVWKLRKEGGVGGKLLAWMEDFLKDREMRTVIRDEPSTFKRVYSGVPQGSVLAPVMFAIYINDIAEDLESYTSLFADDAKILKRVKKREDCDLLQEDLNKIYKWSKKWKMEFNARKCSVLEFGKSKNRPVGAYKLGEEIIQRRNTEKDLGVIVMDDMSPRRHVNKIVGETYNLLKNIRVAFSYIDEDMMKKIIVTMIRPRLEYAAVVWSPNLKKDIKQLERIQRAATKMVPSLENLPYEDRLLKLGLKSLEQRRTRGDLIAMFRLIEGIDKYDRDDLIVRDEGTTRGHRKKLKKGTCRRDVKKYSFPHRITDTWNALDKEVTEATTIHGFKMKLDNYWDNRDGIV